MPEGTCGKCGEDITGGYVVYKGFMYHYLCFARIVESSQGYGSTVDRSAISDAVEIRGNGVRIPIMPEVKPDIDLYALSREVADLKKKIEELKKIVIHGLHM